MTNSIRLMTIAVLGSLVACSSCSNLPRDPEQTLRRVQTRPIRVGLVEHVPWVVRTNDEPHGVEVELIREFAAQLGTSVEWHWGGAQQQMEALESYALDVVIGGFTTRSPWVDSVGFTAPYFKETIRVGALPGTSMKTVKGVAITTADVFVAALLQRHGAIVIRVNDVRTGNPAVAAFDWQLQTMNVTNTNNELDDVKHVIATPMGENAFIKRLDEFLYQKRPFVAGLLQQESTRNETSR